MSEAPAGIFQAPDEVIVMPVEEFLATLKEHLGDSPFVALNNNRSIQIGVSIEDGLGNYPLACVSAVGFHLEDLAEIATVMSMMTPQEQFLIAAQAENQEICDAIRAQLGITDTENEGALPIINPPLPTDPGTHLEMTEGGDSTLMSFG